MAAIGLCNRKEVPATDVSEVLDFRKIGAALNDGDRSVEGVSRLEDVYDWPVYTLDSQPGEFVYLYRCFNSYRLGKLNVVSLYG